MVWEAVAAVGIVVSRSVFGWLENAYEDGEISKFEFEQLGMTLFRIGIPALFAAFGLEVIGFEWAVLGGIAFGGLWDVTFGRLIRRLEWE